MGLCFVHGCNHRSGLNNCSLFSFPKEITKKERWTFFARRQDRSPNNNDRICSCHFPSGSKAEPPSIFQPGQKCINSYKSPEKLRRRKFLKTCNNKENNASEPSPLMEEMDKLKRELHLKTIENDLLMVENAKLKKDHEYKNQRVTLDSLRNTEEVYFYTGLSIEAIYFICKTLSVIKFQYVYSEVISLKLPEQILLVLMKLRHNFPFQDLAKRFCIGRSMAQNIFYTLTNVMHKFFFKELIEKRPLPSLDKISENRPKCFKSFPNCRIIIDCTELYIAVPRQNMEMQSKSYSHYKSNNTFKGLVAVAPNGTITFVSQLYPGSISDKKIVEQSNLLRHLDTGDLILADKGFKIYDLLPRGITLNMPPYLYNPQFTVAEANMTTKIARARIHVERAIGRMKNFKILEFVPHTLRKKATLLFQLCGALVNLQSPLIANDS